MKRQLLVLVGLLSFLAIHVAAEQQKTEEKPFKPLRQVIAEKSPAFEREWSKVVSSGSPDEFLALKKHPENKGLMHYGVFSIGDAFSTFADFGMRPIFVAADEEELRFAVAPGGSAEIKVTADFDMPGGTTRTEECTMYDVSISPKFPMTSGRDQSGWFRATNGTMVGFLTKGLTVEIPEDASVGDITLRVTAKTKGPHKGVVAEKTVERSFTLRVVSSQGVTRENVLCFWHSGVEAKRTLRTATKEEARLKAETTYRSVSDKLTAVAGGRDQALAKLAKQLLAHPEFKR